MEDKIRLKLETSLSTFTPGLLQDALNLSVILDINGLCFGDISDYLAERQNEILRRELVFRKECPVCFDTMDLAPVNTNSGDQTGEGSKSVWTCGSCMNQIYNKYSITERMKQKKGEL